MYGITKIMQGIADGISMIEYPTNNDEDPDTLTNLLFGAVLTGKPAKITLYNGPLCIVGIYDSSEINEGLRGRNKTLSINATLVMIVAGEDSESNMKCYDCIDYCIDYLESTDVSEYGCQVLVRDRNPFQTFPVNLGKPDTPIYATGARVYFTINSTKEDPTLEDD